MPETAKKAETKADEQKSEDSGKLTSKFDRVTDQREFGDVHEYTFADGTTAKVWTLDNDSVGVQFRNAQGRGLSSNTYEDVSITDANALLETAGQKAVDAVKAAEKVN